MNYNIPEQPGLINFHPYQIASTVVGQFPQAYKISDVKMEVSFIKKLLENKNLNVQSNFLSVFNEFTEYDNIKMMVDTMIFSIPCNDTFDDFDIDTTTHKESISKYAKYAMLYIDSPNFYDAYKDGKNTCTAKT